MKKLIESYKTLLCSVGLDTDEDDYVVLKGDKSTKVEHDDGIPFVLPTKDHISTLTVLKAGEAVKVKHLFNPYNESALSLQPAFLKLKQVIEVRLSFMFITCGQMLLRIANDKELQVDPDMNTTIFLSGLQKAYNQGMKQIVDEKTIENWVKVMTNAVKSKVKIVDIHTKTGSKTIYAGVKYARLTTAMFPVFEKFKTLEKDDIIFDVKMTRNKDISVFKMLADFFVAAYTSNEGVVSVGSNDEHAPALLSLWGLYEQLTERPLSVFEFGKNIDPKAYDEFFQKITEVNDLSEFIRDNQSEIALIPPEASGFNNDNSLMNTELKKKIAEARPPVDPYAQQLSDYTPAEITKRSPHMDTVNPYANPARDGSGSNISALDAYASRKQRPARTGVDRYSNYEETTSRTGNPYQTTKQRSLISRGGNYLPW
jgi:hypothetical protein